MPNIILCECRNYPNSKFGTYGTAPNLDMPVCTGHVCMVRYKSILGSCGTSAKIGTMYVSMYLVSLLKVTWATKFDEVVMIVAMRIVFFE